LEKVEAQVSLSVRKETAGTPVPLTVQEAEAVK
jgi:hypothetical protein